jgi:hypothetical protein
VRPPRVVCDNDHGLTNPVGARFPDAELYLFEWHLRHALERLMGKLRTEAPQHQETIDELLPDVEAWERWRAAVRSVPPECCIAGRTGSRGRVGWHGCCVPSGPSRVSATGLPHSPIR